MTKHESYEIYLAEMNSIKKKKSFRSKPSWLVADEAWERHQVRLRTIELKGEDHSGEDEIE